MRYLYDEIPFSFNVNTEDFDYTLPLRIDSILSDYAADIDSDSLYDEIVIEMEVNVTTVGYYSIYLSISTMTTTGYFLDFFETKSQNFYLLQGIQTISLKITSLDLLESFLNAKNYGGEPVISINLNQIYIVDTDGKYRCPNIDHFTLANTYDLNEFDMTIPVSIASVALTMRDATNDSTADYLDVKVGLDIRKLGEITLNVFIYHETSSGSYTYYSKSAVISPTEIGLQTFTISFNLFNFESPIPKNFQVGGDVSVIFNGHTIDFYPIEERTLSTQIETPTTTPTTTKTDSSFTPILIIGSLIITLIIRRKWRKRN